MLAVTHVEWQSCSCWPYHIAMPLHHDFISFSAWIWWWRSCSELSRTFRLVWWVVIPLCATKRNASFSAESPPRNSNVGNISQTTSTFNKLISTPTTRTLSVSRCLAVWLRSFCPSLFFIKCDVILLLNPLHRHYCGQLHLLSCNVFPRICAQVSPTLTPPWRTKLLVAVLVTHPVGEPTSSCAKDISLSMEWDSDPKNSGSFSQVRSARCHLLPRVLVHECIF